MQFDVPSVAVHALGQFLCQQVPGLTVLEEWPYGNEALKYPSVTITKTNPKRTPAMPVIVDQCPPDSDNKILANEYVGDWDDSFQLDLWCRNKFERKSVTEQILKSFSSQEMDNTGRNNPDGLSLCVADYFGEFFRFEIDTVVPMDDEAAAQRQERRQKISVLFNCREIRQRTYYAIKQTQIFTQATSVDSPEGFSDDLNGTEENIV